MRSILIAALAVAAGAAIADPIFRAPNGDWVRFTLAECPASITDKLPEEFREQVRKAVASVGGQDFVGCWLKRGEARALIFEDGDQGIVPESSVHEEPSA